MKRIGGPLGKRQFKADELVRGSVRTFAACVSNLAESCPKISGDEETILLDFRQTGCWTCGAHVQQRQADGG